MMASEGERLELDAPGPGVWQLDVSHFSRPLTRYIRDRYCVAYEEGQALSLARYGMPLRTIGARTVDGFLYIQPMPLSGPPGAAPPPDFVLRLLCRIAPPLRRCRKIATQALESRQWREDARRWSEEVWPRLQAAHERDQGVDLVALSDAELLEHLDRVTDTFFESMVAHFDTNPATMFPTGRLLTFIHAHTDVDGAEVMGAIRARSTVVEADMELLAHLREALAGEPEETLEGPPAEVLSALREREDEVGARARAWLDRVEARQIWAGDVYLPTGRELPQLLVEQLRAHNEAASEPDHNAGADALRARLPESVREEFDSLLTEARSTAYLRDERCAVGDAWAGGIVRLALLEVGRRLEERGLVHSASDAVHLTRAELESLLDGGSGPDLAEVAAHAAAQRRSTETAPPYLGGDQPVPPPSANALLEPLGSMVASVMTYVEAMEGDLGTYHDDELRGTPASPGEYVGVARVVHDPTDFGKVRRGDILVARATMPSYNGALAVAGAVVTDRGGALSHAAIVSRELGIPAVVGTINATKLIKDGARLRVNGTAGEVEVLG